MPIPTERIADTSMPASVPSACTAATTVRVTASGPHPVASRRRPMMPPPPSTATTPVLVPPTSSPTFIGRPPDGRRRRPARPSALDRPGDEPAGHPPLDDEEEDDDRHRDDRRGGHHLSPVDRPSGALLHEAAQPQRQ